jgi:hypothetical protein
MLADGSNPEGVDPEPPLGWASKDDLKDVTVFGMDLSPPDFKIRLHLAFNGVPYRHVKRDGGKTKAAYKKVPSIMVNGRAVNDSFIINKNLIPVLYGESAAAIALEWEQKITFGLQLAFEAEVMEDPLSSKELIKMVGMPGCLASCCCCFLPIGGPNKKIPKSIRTKRAEKNEKYGPLLTAREYLVEFKEAHPSGATFHGGSEPGPVDVSVYATLNWDMPYKHAVVADAGLKVWWDAMAKAMPTLNDELLPPEEPK